MRSYEDIYKKLSTVKKDYNCHKYQIFIDKIPWPRIHSTCNDIGVVFHMDYSIKNQYSLHGTVKQYWWYKNSSYKYNYFFSDEAKHNFAFTSVVVYHILQLHHLSDLTHLSYIIIWPNVNVNMFLRDGKC